MFDRRPLLRWLVPVVVAIALAAAGSVVGVVSAATRGALPQRTAKQLLVDVQKADLAGFSGTVTQTADLGLPSVPGAGGSGSADLSSLVTGKHRLRVWYAGPQRVRVALLGSLGESDVIRHGTDLWTWSSSTKTATHHTVPAKQKDNTHLPATPPTPQQAAQQALAALTPSTTVSTQGTVTVAGRPAYQLVLNPHDPATLVGSVRIAIDGATHVPTRVQVFPRSGHKPAFQVGFTSFDPSVPDPAMFRFTPPKDAKVTDSTWGGHDQGGSSSAAPKPSVVGSGWTSVLVTRLPSGLPGIQGGGSTAAPLTGMLKALPRVSGRWGSGRTFQGQLFSAVLTDNGRLAVGAVPLDKLYGALAAS